MSARLRWTSADLAALPDDGTRYEIIDGELYVSKAPGWEHQFVCGEIYAHLQRWSRQSGAGVANIAPGLIFADDDDVIPDVVWISHARLAAILGSDRKLHGAPELIVEVLSPGPSNEQRDREIKLALYSRHAVSEYWILDWQRRTAEVYRHDGRHLQPAARLGARDALESPLLPGFSCLVGDLFPPSPPLLVEDKASPGST